MPRVAGETLVIILFQFLIKTKQNKKNIIQHEFNEFTFLIN